MIECKRLDPERRGWTKLDYYDNVQMLRYNIYKNLYGNDAAVREMKRIYNGYLREAYCGEGNMKIRFFAADKLKYDLINEGCSYNDVDYAISNCLTNDYDSEDAFELDVRELLGVAADDTQYEGKNG